MTHHVRRRVSAPLLLMPWLAACTTQSEYRRPASPLPVAWANDVALSKAGATPVDRDGWWTILNDDAVNKLVGAALRGNPTLEQAAARVDQARAAVGVQRAQQTPTVGVAGSAARSRDRGNIGGVVNQTATSIGLSPGWELDLWGRVRESKRAASFRLTARTADADSARLSVIGDIADTVLALRACEIILALRDSDISSRETELRIGRSRLRLGSIAPFTLASATSNLANARTQRIAQAEACARHANALVTLSGLNAASVRDLFPHSTFIDETSPASAIATPPPFAPALPATVILGHPAIVAAEREVAARWSEIAVARAHRLPRIDIAAALTGQWIRLLGTSSTYASSSVSASLTAPLFDAGAGAANVRGSQGAYREAVAELDFTIRSTVRDVEDGLAAQQSAELRIATSRDALVAARYALRANEARWRAGAIAQFELEESRRQFNAAQESAVAAAADRARAWIALARRTGGDDVHRD